jgi:hypothetical protein
MLTELLRSYLKVNAMHFRRGKLVLDLQPSHRS